MNLQQTNMNTKEFHIIKTRIENYLLLCGFNLKETKSIFTSLLSAEMYGAESHGMNRIFSGFIESLTKSFMVEPNKEPLLIKDSKNYLLYDGNFALGYYGIWQIIHSILFRMSYSDIVFCNVKNLYPTNVLFEYAKYLNDLGYACFITSKSPNKIIPPIDVSKEIIHAKPVVGTNAICWGFPVKDSSHVIFDTTMAASTNGNLLLLKNGNYEKFDASAYLSSNFKIPNSPEELFDENKNFNGYILPFGWEDGYKGFGNLLTAELFNFFQDLNVTDTSTTLIVMKIQNLERFDAKVESFRNKISDAIQYRDHESKGRLPFQKKITFKSNWNESEFVKKFFNLSNSLPNTINRIYSIELTTQNEKGKTVSGREIDLDSPGGRVITRISSGQKVAIFHASTPLQLQRIKQSNIYECWLNTEIPANFFDLAGSNDDSLSKLDLILSKLIDSLDGLNIFIDWDSGWDIDLDLPSKSFQIAAKYVSFINFPILVTGAGLPDEVLIKISNKLKMISQLLPNVLLSVEFYGQNIGNSSSVVTFAFIEKLIKWNTHIDFVSIRVGSSFSFIDACNYVQLFKEKFSLKCVLSSGDDLVSMNLNDTLSCDYDIIITKDPLKADENRYKYDYLSSYKSELIHKTIDAFLEHSGLSISRSYLTEYVFDLPLDGENFFDKWNLEDYDLPRLSSHGRLVEAICSNLDFNKEDAVLDIGCGTGMLIKHLGEIGEYLGVDISSKMLDSIICNQDKYSFPIKTLHGDFLDLPIDRKFSKIISILCMHHFKNNEKASVLRKCNSLLAGSGLFSIGETFLDTLNLSSKENLLNISNLYLRKMLNCIENKCNKHALKDLQILRRILFSDGEYMVNVRQWEQLLMESGFSVKEKKIVDPLVQYGYLILEKKL